MRIDVLTLFPGMFAGVLDESMLKRARMKGKLNVAVHDLRAWTRDAHKTADDKPFGGGPGMVMKIEPIYEALEELGALRGQAPGRRGSRRKASTILLTPQGRTLTQGMAREFAGHDRLTLVCGHYEGFDERVRSLVDDEVSIGDYVLTGGELPAMVLIDAVARLIPGVLGKSGSLESESFEHGMLEYPQYTRPAEYRGMAVPDILLSGDHRKIDAWRRAEALRRTEARRPDLMARRGKTADKNGKEGHHAG